MTKTQHHDDQVVTYRNGIIENSHSVHAAVVDSTGKLLFSVGNPSRVTLIRSAAKPAQALAVVETGGFDQCGFSDADLALMCASHSSESKHIDRARQMLAKVQAEESDLRCGGHESISPEVNRNWIKEDFTPTAICNNCSGKHVGMLAGAKAIGAAMADYHLPGHAIQTRVKAVVEEVAGLGPDEVEWGVDGCNMPAPAFPLVYLGKTYAAFAEAADAVGRGESVSQRTQWSSRIFNTMCRHPDLVAGKDRFCTSLMGLHGGQLIGKLGADGCYGIGIKASEDTRRLGADGAVGIAVKIGDGNIAILYAAVSEILAQLQIGTPEMRGQLESFHHFKLVNTMGVSTGHVSFPFTLHQC